MINLITPDRFNPFTAIESAIAIVNEVHYVPGDSPYYVQLRECPSAAAITILGYTEVAVATTPPLAGTFQVDRVYKTGLVRFPFEARGLPVSISYAGTGTVLHAEIFNQLILGYRRFTDVWENEYGSVEMPMLAGMWHYHELVDECTWSRSTGEVPNMSDYITHGPWSEADHVSHAVVLGVLSRGTQMNLYRAAGGVPTLGNPGPLGSGFYSLPNSLPLRFEVRAKTNQMSTSISTLHYFAGMFFSRSSSTAITSALPIVAAAFCWSDSLAGPGRVALVFNSSVVGTYPASLTTWQTYTLDYTPGLVRAYIAGTLVSTFSTWIVSPGAYIVPSFRAWSPINTTATATAFYVDRISCIPTGELLLPV